MAGSIITVIFKQLILTESKMHPLLDLNTFRFKRMIDWYLTPLSFSTSATYFRATSLYGGGKPVCQEIATDLRQENWYINLIKMRLPHTWCEPTSTILTVYWFSSWATPTTCPPMLFYINDDFNYLFHCLLRLYYWMIICR